MKPVVSVSGELERSSGARGLIPLVASEELGSKARHAVTWSALQIILRNALSVAVTAILARLLAPEDYGLIGMVATLTALLLVFADMGLSWASVQRACLTHAQVNALFWINMLAGVGLWLSMIAAGPFLAIFYGEPALATIAAVSGISFLLSGIAVQPMALLTRAMDFRRIAIIEVAALAGGAVVAVMVAVSGGGYWALVAQGPVQALVRAVLSMRAAQLRITSPRSTEGLGALLSFGGLLAANGLLIYLARNLDSVLIGHIWGAAELGIYNRAYFLMLFPSMLANGVLSGLMVSALSGLQNDRQRFADTYRRALRLTAYVAMPIAAGLALTAAPAVELVYGSGWQAVVPILAWLSIAALTQPIYNTNGWLFVAAGRGWAYFLLNTFNAALLVTVFVWAAPYGALAVAQGYGLVMGVILPVPVLWLAHRVVGIPFLPSLQTLSPVVVLTAIMAGAVWSVDGAAAELGGSPMLVFALQIAVGIAVYLALTPVVLSDMVNRDFPPFLARLNRKITK